MSPLNKYAGNFPKPASKMRRGNLIDFSVESLEMIYRIHYFI